MPPPRRIFLTGGTGLVGSHLAERLVASGHAVVALVRENSDTRHLRTLGAELRPGDLLDAAGTHAARMEGCDAVVHTAALVFTRAAAADFHRANVLGTESVVRGAAGAGIRRVVHVSSIAVYGGEGTRRPIREEDWLRGEIAAGAAYARSKRDAERVAWALAETERLELTTLRPGVIYGERDRAFAPLLARVLRAPVLPLPGGGQARPPVVYAGSVAAAIESALFLVRAAGRSYTLAADSTLSVRAFIDAFARELGRRPRLVTVPGTPVLASAALLDLAARVLPGVPTVRVRRAARRLLEDHPFDQARAEEELGWGRVTEAEAAIAATAKWLADGR
ncbi:MAG TPA: NAD-dependent epimerase/dehydratase family protein [Longimicrobiales bacterium]|nr:NAD-dependent epimerase/dehydratase family protein [Longimicrobiales bacterium]